MSIPSLSSNAELKSKAISFPDTYWMLAYGIAVTVLVSVAFGSRAYDDPFITYRYAANLLKGEGFVYNPGERVLSTTTPLFTLLLVLLGGLWKDAPHLAVLVGGASLAAGGLLLWDLSRTWATPLVGWSALLLYPSFPLLIATLGSETPIYLALCLAAFAAYFHHRYSLAGLAAGFAALARPDGVLVAGVLAAHFLVTKKDRIPWLGLLLFGLVLLGWGVSAWVYFGSPLPATLAAKQQQGAMAISQQFAEGLFTILRGYRSWVYVVEGLFALFGVGYAIIRRSDWLWLFSWTTLYFVSYSLLGVSRYFWYYAPLVPGFIAAAGLGLYAVGSRLTEREESDSARTTWMKYLAIPILILMVAGQLRSLWSTWQHPDNRSKIYQAVGNWLNENTLPGQSVGALEVGIIGYYADRRMVDFAGLIQPEIAEQLTSGKDYEDAAIWAAETYQPDYLVLQEGLFSRLEAEYVRKNCRAEKEFQGSSYGYPANLYVFNCSG